MKVGIIDYRMGNLASVAKALEAAGAEPHVSARPDELSATDVLVLPGVGNFAAGMANLIKLNLGDYTIEWAAGGKPLLGICMGMQLFFEESDEGPFGGTPFGGTPPEFPPKTTKPIGGTPPEFPPKTTKPIGGTPPEFPPKTTKPIGGTPPESPPKTTKGLGIFQGRVERFDDRLKVPHMGWNTLRPVGNSPIFEDFDGRHFYFVHSYYCRPAGEYTGTRTGYGIDFCSAIHASNVVGVQFHPEKSSDDGLELLRRMLKELAP